jgi:uncharacterized protein YbjT (DUF2867 family)
MKYAITGGAGNISRPIAETLLEKGHEVTVIGRNVDHLKPLVDKGAVAAIGSVEDTEFLQHAFGGAHAVYTMVPPNFTATDMKSFAHQVVLNYIKAINANQIKYVVNLSSMGAHLLEGAGPVSGLARGERAFNALEHVNIRHLRPGYFYQNLLGNIGMARQMNIIGSNFSIPAGRFPLTDPTDIAEAASEELLLLNFTGHSVRYIASDEAGTQQIAEVIGRAIGKPDLQWVKFPDDQALNGLQQAGFPDEAARNYIEMGQALHSGTLLEDYWEHRPTSLGKIKLDQFAKQFAAIYHSN